MPGPISEFALPLITTVQIITADRRLVSGQSLKAIRFAEQAWTDLDYRGAPPSVPPANASVAAADSAAL